MPLFSPPSTPPDRAARRAKRRQLLGAFGGFGVAGACGTRGALAATTPARDVAHALGRTLIRGTPERVITLFQGATDTAVALGVTPVGIVESWTEKPVYVYLREALGQVAQVGLETQPSLEDIVMLEPDLIVASRFRNERIYRLLSAIAPTVALNDVFSFDETLAVMARALDREADAAAIRAAWQTRTGQLRQALARRFGAQWPLTVSVLEFREDHVRAYLPDSMSGKVLSELGFVRTPYQSDVTQTLSKITSREAIPFLDAQMIFVLLRSERPAVRQSYLNWRDHPLWQTLQAVRNDRVYEVDTVAWSLSGGMLGATRMLDDLQAKLGDPTRVSNGQRHELNGQRHEPNARNEPTPKPDGQTSKPNEQTSKPDGRPLERERA